jgi:hypothetical protein
MVDIKRTGVIADADVRAYDRNKAELRGFQVDAVIVSSSSYSIDSLKGSSYMKPKKKAAHPVGRMSSAVSFSINVLLREDTFVFVEELSSPQKRSLADSNELTPIFRPEITVFNSDDFEDRRLVDNNGVVELDEEEFLILLLEMEAFSGGGGIVHLSSPICSCSSSGSNCSSFVAPSFVMAIGNAPGVYDKLYQK